ncbi:MAG TPA: hypothetical protein ENN28_00700 [Candidatus Uhrbacteria bacterium]|nr:hypothetical protein [Candidatus Uhrbacteria bacterium]
MSQSKKQSLEKLVEKNLKKTDFLIEKVEKLEKDFKRFQLMNLLRFLIIIVPIFLAVLYLIPFFRQIFEAYSPFLDFLNQFR